MNPANFAFFNSAPDAVVRSRRLIIAFILLCLVAGCAVNPVTGERELSLIPESQELAIGAEQYVPSQQSQGGLYTADRDIGLYVNRVGNKLAAVSDRQLPYEFVVINDSSPNAWALPGGKIAVNRGLLTELGSEAELAAVLGHEIVHAAAKHGAKSMQRGMVLQGVVMASAIGASMSDNDYANYVVGGAQLGAQLINQSYSRSAELESDFYGMQYMKRAGYNPNEAVKLQETFVKLSEGRRTNWLEGMFASHPPSEERVATNRETAQALGSTGEIGADRYRKVTKRLFDKAPAYKSFDEALTLARSNKIDDAMAKVQNALSIEPAEARFYGLKADLLMEKNQYQAAAAEYNKALARDDNYFEYYLGRGLAREQLGQRVQSREDLERSNQLLPTAIANAKLGEMSLALGETAKAKNYFATAMVAGGELGRQATLAFVRLDLPERPSAYLSVQPALTESRQMVAALTNTTDLMVNAIDVEFQVTVNGNLIRTVVRTDVMAPKSREVVVSPWNFSEADVVENASARVVGARL